MSSPDREGNRNGHRKREHSAAADSDNEMPAGSEEHKHSSSNISSSAPRIWALPTIAGSVWTVTEEPRPVELAHELCREPAVVLTAEKNPAKQSEVAAAARQSVSTSLRELTHESAFVFVSRLILSIGWLLLAVVGLRLPGEVEFLDTLLLSLGVVFFIYTLTRHGSSVMRAHHRRLDAENAFQNARVVRSALLARFSHALALRKKLKPDERGKSPDEELLDANAYRKLIQEGVASRAELVALGHAVKERLRTERNTTSGELARNLQLDMETLLLYREFVHAAEEIDLDIE